MPFVRKSLVLVSSLIAMNSLFLFIAKRVEADTTVHQKIYSLKAQILAQNTLPKFTRVITPSSLLKKPNTDSFSNNIAAESTTDLERGSPSLRRQPSGGERFEPKRIPLKIPLPEQPYRASPSITIINPSAYGASWGSLGLGFGFQERARFTDESDGVIGLGFGLGNSQKNVGAQVGISLVDVSAPFRDGAINLKLHRRLPKDFAIALGVQGITTWGETDGGSSVYGVTTKRFKLRKDRTQAFSELYATLGLGGGQFRSESDIDNGNETIGIFGSVAVKILEPVGLVTEWSGQDLTIGVPLVLFRKLPLVIVPAITDITGAAGDGTRIVFGIGYSFSF
jgi:hypothetical protein